MISVIVPVYNTENFLNKCLLSIANQTYTDLQIICINDGSSDNSGKILAEFAKNDSRFIVIEQSNMGVSVARNKGLEVATGEYITFVDSDDELAPNMYQTLIDIFKKENNPDCKIVHCGYRRVKPDGTFKDVSGTYDKHILDRKTSIFHLLNGTLFVPSLWNKLIHSSILRGLKFASNLKINEDVLLCYEIFKSSACSVYYDAPLYRFNEHSTSTCSTTNSLSKALDVLTVSRLLSDDCKDTEFSTAANTKLYHALCGAYRSYLFYNVKESKVERKKLENEITKIKQLDILVSQKHNFNYALMRTLPRLYVLMYTIYDKIRKPNWDVN